MINQCKKIKTAACPLSRNREITAKYSEPFVRTPLTPLESGGVSGQGGREHIKPLATPSSFSLVENLVGGGVYTSQCHHWFTCFGLIPVPIVVYGDSTHIFNGIV